MSAAAATTTTSSSRWSPTAEQLMILEEMYRRGITTPKASQIQHITSYLSHFGRIEGKNVFYWFQNHKARDRQRLRRQLIAIRQQQQQQHHQQQQQQEQLLLHPQQHSTVMPAMTTHQYHHHQYLIHDRCYCSIANNTTASGCSAFQPLSVYNSFTKYFSDQGLSWSREKLVEADEAKEERQPGGGGEYYCCVKPLRTLELFPTKSSSSSIEDECNLTLTT